MNPRYLIDSIVRQTTVLIAQLSTAAGIRAPLSHVADQVFLDLAREIESQGVGRKVAADMFGVALRTYQTKLQRIEESASQRDRTLWEAVLDHIADQEAPTRAQVLERFRRDGERAVAAVLNDLVSSGLVYCSGKGNLAIYRVTSEADRRALGAAADTESIANLVWVHIYREGDTTEAELAARWPSARGLLPEVLRRLTSEQRIVRRDSADGEARYSTDKIVIPIGDELGWEGAVFDHFRAMATAIAHKLALPSPRSELDQQIGGATLTFDIYEGHPQAAEVLNLLAGMRAQGNALWERVKTTNTQPPPDDCRRMRVTFYLGQNVEESDV